MYYETSTNQSTVQLGALEKEQTFALLKSAPSYLYENGKKTNIIDGQRYTVANIRTYDKFDVKTPEKTPIVSAEQIASANERIFVSFVNAVAKPIKIEYGKISFSVTADGAKIVRKAN